MKEGALSRIQLAAYSSPSFATSVAALPMALFVPAFYADDLGVSLAAVGGAIAVSRLLDVVTDPLIGALSDRFPTRLGRRRPWMLLGVPVFLISLWRIFVPDGPVSAGYLTLWSALLYLGFTLIDLPHKAWGAELSDDYDERSRITSWREAIATAGQVSLLAALVVLAAMGINAADQQLRGIALGIVVGLPVLTLACVLSVQERDPRSLARERPRFGLGLVLVARNPAFLRMIGCVLFFVSGVAIQGTLHRLVLADVMRDESSFPLMILLENVATLAAVPAWLAISMRIGKHRALMAAAFWIAAWSLPLIWLREGETNLMIAIVTIRGSSFASILFLAHSIAADVIDLDTLESGEQRSGLFFAIWGMVIKLSLALGVVLGTSLPSAIGYDPSLEGITPTIATGLMWIYGGVPAVLMGVGSFFLWDFPITRQRLAVVQEKLRRASASGS